MTTRRIFFTRLALDARIGILEHELRATQPLHIDADIDMHVDHEVNDHDIRSVLDYRKLREAIIEECTRAHVHLVETLGDMVIQRLLKEFPEVYRVKVRIGKPLAFSDCAAVGVEVEASR